MLRKFKRLPKHVGIIPDGNRRWAIDNGYSKEMGYYQGLESAKELFEVVYDIGIKEVSAYCFTKENTKRPKKQVEAYTEALLYFVNWLKSKDVSVLVIGDTKSKLFPKQLEEYTTRMLSSERKLNLLVNYNWKWDIEQYKSTGYKGSRYVSNIDMVIRWGDRCRLSGFLPLQCAYADIFVIKDMFPDFEESQFYSALKWYQKQDVTMGG